MEYNLSNAKVLVRNTNFYLDNNVKNKVALMEMLNVTINRLFKEGVTEHLFVNGLTNEIYAKYGNQVNIEQLKRVGWYLQGISNRIDWKVEKDAVFFQVREYNELTDLPIQDEYDEFFSKWIGAMDTYENFIIDELR